MRLDGGDGIDSPIALMSKKQVENRSVVALTKWTVCYKSCCFRTILDKIWPEEWMTEAQVSSAELSIASTVKFRVLDLVR